MREKVRRGMIEREGARDRGRKRERRGGGTRCNRKERDKIQMRKKSNKYEMKICY